MKPRPTRAKLTPEASRELYSRTVNALYAMDPLFRPYSRWVMDPEWLEQIIGMVDHKGDWLWEGWEQGLRPEWLFGKPWATRPGAGFPHLEVTPVDVPPPVPSLA